MIIIEPDSTRNHVTVISEAQEERIDLLDRPTIIALFKIYGAILFKGFPMGMKQFRAAAMLYSTNFVLNESGNRRQVDEAIQTVNLGYRPFPLHSELARLPWRPDIAWFGCAIAPESGGETTICDGTRIVEELRQELRSFLKDRSFLYKEEVSIEEYERWSGDMEIRNQYAFVFSREGGRFFRSYVAPVLEKPLFSEKPAFVNFLLFARYELQVDDFPVFEDESRIPDEICDEIKGVSDKLTVPVKWESGDLLMLDNTRFMHGRNEVVDTEQRLIFTQFSYASFLPPLRPDLSMQPWRHTGMNVGQRSG